MSARRRLAIEALESRLVLDSVGLEAPDAAGGLPQRVIVLLNEDVGDVHQAAEELVQPFQARLGHVYQHAVEGFSVELPAAAVSALQSNPMVKLVEPDAVVRAAGQTVPTGVDRIDAEPGLFQREGDVDVDIAILDTGIYAGHLDLNVMGGTHFYTIAAGPPRNRGQFQDDNYADDNGHGTHVAGIAGAIDEEPGTPDSTDGWGYVGVAPGARLWAVKVLDANGAGYESDLIAGVDWVVAQGDIEVANMSLTAPGYSAALRTAIQNGVNAGIVFVAAAGNEYQDVYGADGVFGNNDDIFPASFPEVATISALSDTDGQPGGLGELSSYQGSDRDGDGYDDGLDDSFACFSNFSRSVVQDNPVSSPGAAIDLVMPGVDIWSTWTDGQWVQISGTSQAAPHAAGLAALYIAEHGPATDAAGVYAIRQALIDGGMSQATGMRLVDPYTATEPDAYPENLGWAGPVGDVTDLAVVEVSAPASAVLGEPVSVDVTVTNVGNQDVTSDVNVTLTDETDEVTIGTQTISGGLAAGASTALTFSWDTTDATIGDHTLTATQDFADDHAGNDASSAVVALEAAVTDIAVIAVDAPSSASQGTTVDVVVTVENVGNQDVNGDVNVILTDETDGGTIGTQTITGGLVAGASTALTFSWDTTDATIGDHTLTATQDFADDHAGNDASSAVVGVQDVGAAMHVADLDGSATIISKNWWQANVAICVLNAHGVPVAGATVTGVWGNGTTSVSSPTGVDGWITVTSATLHRRVASTTFTVTAVTHDTWTYDPSANTDPDGDSDGTSITIPMDAVAAGAMVSGDPGSLEAMYHEIAWYYALQQRTESQSQKGEGASPQVVDYLLAQNT